MRLKAIVFGLSLGLLIGVGGCSGEPAAKTAAPASVILPPGPLVGPADVKLTADEELEIKGLKDEADEKLALAQKVCPVTYGDKDGEGHLGTMGPPIKKVVAGKTVFLCCGSCSKAIEADPARYLAKFPAR